MKKDKEKLLKAFEDRIKKVSTSLDKSKKAAIKVASKKKKKYKKLTRIKQIGVVLALLLLVAGSIFSYFYIFKDLPDPRGLQDYGVIPLSTQIYDRDGELLYEIFRDQNRTPVKLADLPKYVPQATIAIEDSNFYKHSGISLVGGIFRALKDTYILQKGTQGGSTITQQLIKSALLTPERTIQRKIKEAVLAIQVEQILTKDEILELYLNQVPYGGVSYGIQEAAQSYFDKDAKELELHEAALLAGLPRAPTLYNPYTNFDRAKARQEEVLKRMAELGYITEDERKEASAAELDVRPPTNEIKAPHFVFYIRSILEEEYDPQLVEEGGLKVYTSLDYDVQASAEAILKEEIEEISNLNIQNGAVLATRPATGEILAMVGSVDFFATGSGSFNVTTALRQPGSSIKPLNYAVGIDKGIVTPASVFNDGPTCFAAPGQPDSYCPRNYDGSFRGPVQLRYALANSLNIPAVKMLAKNTVEDFVASASAFGITSFEDPQRYGLSLTLGGGEVMMTEMAQAFSAFANEGIPRKLNAILKIEDRNGKVIYEYKDPNIVEDITEDLGYPNFLAIDGERAISKETAFQISHILSDDGARSQAFGTGSLLNIPGKKVSVKTGTTNDLRDNWTIGYTPNFLVATWVGNNDNSRMSYVASGVTGATPIWNRIMALLLENQSPLEPRLPDGVVGVQVCTVSGAIPGTGSSVAQDGVCQTRFEYITKGNENIGSADVKREEVPIQRETGVMTTFDDPLMELREHTLVWDGLTNYCIDCAHEGEGNALVRIIGEPDENQPTSVQEQAQQAQPAEPEN